MSHRLWVKAWCEHHRCRAAQVEDLLTLAEVLPHRKEEMLRLAAGVHKRRVRCREKEWPIS
jgi:hypothetical protein